MSLLAPLGLLLLVALPVLAWLAMQARRPRVVEVGTLMIWRRVVQDATTTSQARRRHDPLLYFLLAACGLGAVGSARPAQVDSTPVPTVAVYVESLGGDEPGLESVVERAREAAGDARLRLWFAGDGALFDGLGTVNALNRAELPAELAQFEAASTGHEARLLFLAAPTDQARRLGLVLPRVAAPRAGIIWEIRSEGPRLFVRMSEGLPPKVEGASLAGVRTQGREFTREYDARAEIVRITSGGQGIDLRRAPLSVGTGADWNSQRHLALLRALQPAAGAPQAEVWLGGVEQSPAVRINQGRAADMDGLETRFDWQHALFAELPMSGLDFARSGRVMEPAANDRALALLLRDGKPVGALVTLSGDGRVLKFAGDPFAELSVTNAALLLDNAVGVLTGRRPSDRPLYELAGPALPTRRQAMAAPFEPEGDLSIAAPPAQTSPWSHWVLAVGAVAALAAAMLAMRKP